MILITGCARSGTSLTASIFKSCGANLGDHNTLFEHKVIRDGIVKPYLKRTGADPMGQHPLPNVHNLAPFPDLREKIETAAPGVDCYKGAKMCLVWPVWAEAYPEAKWVIVRRDRDRIIDSCLRTSFMRAHRNRQGWSDWVDHHLARFDEMKASLDVVEVWPHEFTEGNEAGMQSAVEHAGLVWDSDRAQERLKPGRWHG